LLSLDAIRLDFLYKEAKRQRADKAYTLFNLIQTLMLEKQDSKRIVEDLKAQLNPHKVERELTQTEVNDSWKALRLRRR